MFQILQHLLPDPWCAVVVPVRILSLRQACSAEGMKLYPLFGAMCSLAVFGDGTHVAVSPPDIALTTHIVPHTCMIDDRRGKSEISVKTSTLHVVYIPPVKLL